MNARALDVVDIVHAHGIAPNLLEIEVADSENAARLRCARTFTFKLSRTNQATHEKTGTHRLSRCGARDNQARNGRWRYRAVARLRFLLHGVTRGAHRT
jgi:hypothetical protein